MDQKILEELKQAKKLGTKNKKEAMRCLQRKARYQKQQAIVDGQRDTLEAQVRRARIAASGPDLLSLSFSWLFAFMIIIIRLRRWRFRRRTGRWSTPCGRAARR